MAVGLPLVPPPAVSTFWAPGSRATVPRDREPKTILARFVQELVAVLKYSESAWGPQRRILPLAIRNIRG